MIDLRDEIVECVLAKLRTGEIPKDVWDAAVAEQPESLAVAAYARALLREIRSTNELEARLKRRYDQDELIRRRIAPDMDAIRERIMSKLVDREFDRRVAAGEIVAIVGDDGETYYVSADD